MHLTMNQKNQTTISDIIEELGSHKREIIGNNANEVKDYTDETKILVYEKNINIFVSEYLKEIQEESTDNTFYWNIYKEISSKNNKMKENEDTEDNRNNTGKIITKEEQLKEPSESGSKFQSEKNHSEDVTEMNKEELAKYYKHAADQGDVESMQKCAALLENGDGIEENKKETSCDYKSLADRGS